MIPSEYLGTQHRLLVLDVEIKYPEWKKRRVGDPRVKWWTLTKENVLLLAERITEEGACRRVEDADTVESYGRLYSKVGERSSRYF